MGAKQHNHASVPQWRHPSNKIFPSDSCFMELQKYANVLRQTEHKLQQIFLALRQKSHAGELEYRNKSCATAEVPAYVFLLIDPCCFSSVLFSSDGWKPSKIYSQNHLQWAQTNSLVDGSMNRASGTPDSSFGAVRVVILREVVSEKQTICGWLVER